MYHLTLPFGGGRKGHGLAKSIMWAIPVGLREFGRRPMGAMQSRGIGEGPKAAVILCACAARSTPSDRERQGQDQTDAESPELPPGPVRTSVTGFLSSSCGVTGLPLAAPGLVHGQLFIPQVISGRHGRIEQLGGSGAPNRRLPSGPRTRGRNRGDGKTG